ncbi:tRNA pseudouridine(13) synthase TruD [Dokdonella sp.]|uniref:tRNA pseudouridine(13) synthase TruD n=1 Tax=Dokdonella sp. TaxID=2291710 RepID=UPI001B1941C1|nr:tRNA pseudouridine(13) synthase TruD [Dokdonella sp.]MBO9663532.1 tRNA pseudouridine(13) synthase TruD [Dokdonella sp.]
MNELPFAHGAPPLRGRLRADPADFTVEEELGFEPSGQGEHAFLVVEKVGANTEWVARRLAAAAGVAPVAVGYAGLKDRHALTRQAFTVQLPGRVDPDWSALGIAGVTVLSATRHDRKLKRGAHRGNRFRIRLRDVQGDRAEAETRIEAMRARGVPNYFGEQRFGREQGNLDLAEALFAGKRLPREQRGFALSAARAELFNAVLAARVADGSWDRGLDGEVWMLAGSNAIFGPEPWSDELARRLAEFDIDPTGPMWGAGELRSTGAAREVELAALEPLASFARGLEREALSQQRRALRLRAEELRSSWEADDALVLDFRLPAGAFATTVVRELCDTRSAST